jgi:uncharacterized protein (TIGR02145 family)
MKRVLWLGVFCCGLLLSCVPARVSQVDKKMAEYSTSNESSQQESSSQPHPVVKPNPSDNEEHARMSEHQRKCLEKKATDYDGNSYSTVYIGNQCWIKENLRSRHGYDGHELTYYAPNDNSKNVSQYGYLYDWSSARKVCPQGWHLPSDKEWVQLEQHIGRDRNNLCDTNTKNIAKSMCSTWGWKHSSSECAIGNNPSANNASGFDIVPAGLYNSGYFGFGYYTNFWSSTELQNGFAYDHGFNCNNPNVTRYVDGKGSGFSVRCIRN